MLDFLSISTKSTKRGSIEIYPKFIINNKSNDLMIRGSDFYAVWMEDRGLWSTDEQDALRLIDQAIDKYAAEHQDLANNNNLVISHMWDADSGMIDKWHKYCQKQSRDNYHMLDEKIIFSNTSPKKRDYASKTLPYPLEECDTPAFDELMSVLYSPEEREKLEWAIGSIVTGDSKKIQKFMVLYGAAGTGKSTVLNIIQQLFEGYYSVFDAKALGSTSNSFALEAFKTNPLVAIQHDGDLSHIEDNTRLNSLVSHELMTVNEKFKSTYSQRFKSFLFMGTNKPVKITDGRSGLLRRLIDVSPTGKKIPPGKYNKLIKQIEFELGGIAWKCKQVYLDDPRKYDNYIPTGMLGASNDFYNFMLDNYYRFKRDDQVSLQIAWSMYDEYCKDARVLYPFSRRVFQEELKNYFWSFEERARLEDNSRIRNLYSGFRTDKFERMTDPDEEPEELIKFSKRKSIFDKELADRPAQYASDKETPQKKWSDVNTTLAEIDTSELHYVKVPTNHIVIDFDIPDESGEKSFELNLKEASKWPKTYAELSKSGKGIHLHYIYDGDPMKLQRIYSDHVEIKVFSGNSSLRRKLTKCNGEGISHINTGLPLKGEKEMVNFESFKNEKALRTIIIKNLKKEIHASTKPSVDFIFKNLEDAYNSDLSYDVSDMRGAIFAFACSSTNQSEYCTKLVSKMHFKSKDREQQELEEAKYDDKPIIFYDVEVFPNLFLINWKYAGEDQRVVRMINPTALEVEELIKGKLVGFNCRRYDNHILYGRLLGYSNLQLYELSQRIISGDKDAFFSNAYDISYTDVYDFSSKKQSLKKFEIELGIHHQELGLPWDQPVDESLWMKVAEYCGNDVIATEAVFNARKGDWTAREILAEVAGMNVNSTTNSLTTRIIFGSEKHPKLVYTDLSETFPGYEFKHVDEDNKMHNIYKGIDVGFGGYVYSEPGMYGNVALLDVASLHPHSIIAMNCFGDYTKNFKDLLDARIAIKHKDYKSAKKMLDGKLAKYLDDESQAADLAQALKIAINSVYGLTSASFSNPFRDERNKNNIVALRGALFMIDLMEEVQKRGFKVAHIKTDSIKIPDATPDIIFFCMDFAQQYGYTFEHEATYDRMCLVNDAVYIAKYKTASECEDMYGYIPGDCKKHGGEWTATGTQFQVPYVFKKLFSKEDIRFEDMCETKEVKTALYLGKDGQDPKDYLFVGKVGSFCPMQEGYGYHLYREKDGKFGAATGTKGYEWQEAESVKTLGKDSYIDKSYYDRLCNEAIETISQYGDYEWFVSDDPYISPPWIA